MSLVGWQHKMIGDLDLGIEDNSAPKRKKNDRKIDIII
jgi:hypothetical protein